MCIFFTSKFLQYFFILLSIDCRGNTLSHPKIKSLLLFQRASLYDVSNSRSFKGIVIIQFEFFLGEVIVHSDVLFNWAKRSFYLCFFRFGDKYKKVQCILLRIKFEALDKRQIALHIAQFISDIWQIHAFGEGNTRTTAVFAIKYLRTFGFYVTNDMFADNSWYFRNALVRANYNDYKRNIFSTQEFLNRFFCNLLLGEKNTLRNRELLISVTKPSIDTVKPTADTVNDTVFLLIKENPHITADALSSKLGISIATIKRRIKKLKDGGVISRVGSDKTGFWKVHEN